MAVLLVYEHKLWLNSSFVLLLNMKLLCHVIWPRTHEHLTTLICAHFSVILFGGANINMNSYVVVRQRVDQMWTMFNQYVKTRTQDNFKFWIVSFCSVCDFPLRYSFLSARTCSNYNWPDWGRVTAIYKLYGCVPLWRVWFSGSLVWDRDRFGFLV